MNIKKYSDLPVAVGFGVRDSETAKQVALISDAVVIGSRIVLEVESSSQENILVNIKKLMDEIKKAIS